MVLVLDSSDIIAAERRGDTPEQLVQQVIRVADNQEAAIRPWAHRASAWYLSCQFRPGADSLRSSIDELDIGLTVYRL